jgi:hypothetical protein
MRKFKLFTVIIFLIFLSSILVGCLVPIAMEMISEPCIYHIWGTSLSDVFATGSTQGSGVLHYDGNTWTKMKVPTPVRGGYIWGSSSSDVFSIGQSNIIFHWNGSTWTLIKADGKSGFTDISDI